MTTSEQIDEDVILACVDLVGRAGARGFEIGYEHDDVPAEEAGWYAHAQLRGARILVSDHRGPSAAAQALAERILKGAKCKCGKVATITPDGAFAFFKAHTVDGQPWGAREAARAGQCLWRRVGRRWVSACDERGNGQEG